jgi:hypothetical protein
MGYYLAIELATPLIFFSKGGSERQYGRSLP